MWYYAVTAGSLASLSAVFGKLAFSGESTSSNQLLFYGSIFGYILCNVLMWWAHATAMRLASSSLKAVAINTATNFILTGIFGAVFFAELHSLQWWFGLSVMFCGTMLVIQSHDDQSD